MTPLPNWSVLDAFILTAMTVGFSWLSTEMSPEERCLVVSCECCVEIVNSLQRRKPKKARRHAAHSIFLLNSVCGSLSSPDLICSRMAGVIGSLGLDWCGLIRRIPFKTKSSLGMLVSGFSRPCVNVVHLIGRF